MTRRSATRQRGAVLLIMVMIVGLGATWYLVSRLNDNSGFAAAARKERDAEVLNRAKRALIGYVAAEAASAVEDNPGALPCPEAAGYFDNPSQEGQTASSCTLPKVGRFPWRTIGTEKLVDSSGEPLWYVVSPGWAPTTSGAKTNINSNTPGQLTVDGVANAAVALIIAPGPAFSAPACGTSGAISQARPAIGTPDWRNYLECENATYPTPDATFVTTGPSGSFNDQVIVVTVADIMPGIEAAIAKRIDNQIVPALKTVYTPTTWGFAGNNPVMPYAAAPFANPGPGTGTSNYRGTLIGTSQGLLPFNQTQDCTESASDPRCTTATTGGTAFLVFSKSGGDFQTAGGGSIKTQSTCSWQSAVFICTGEYYDTSVSVRVRINVTNVAMGLRTLDTSKITCSAVDDTGAGIPEQNVPCTSSAALQTNGSVTLTINTSAMPSVFTSGWNTYANYKIKIDRAAIGDHPLLSATDPGTCPSYGCTGWFVRNEWYRLLYYAVPASNTAALVASERSCASVADCLTVTSATATTDTTTPTALLLLLTGSSVNGSARPSSTLSDYLESTNATGTYVKKPVNTAAATAARFNDRLAAFHSN